MRSAGCLLFATILLFTFSSFSGRPGPVPAGAPALQFKVMVISIERLERLRTEFPNLDALYFQHTNRVEDEDTAPGPNRGRNRYRLVAFARNAGSTNLVPLPEDLFVNDPGTVRFVPITSQGRGTTVQFGNMVLPVDSLKSPQDTAMKLLVLQPMKGEPNTDQNGRRINLERYVYYELSYVAGAGDWMSRSGAAAFQRVGYLNPSPPAQLLE